MAEIAKIQKPEAGRYAGKKKLYCVRNVYLPPNAPEDYRKIFHTYWDEAEKQLEKIEAAGKIQKIFCENIHTAGEEALDTIGKTNERAVRLIRKKMSEGGTLLPLEKEEIFMPFLDWGNCLLVIRSREVIEKVYGFYTGLLDKRFEHILNVIEENLAEGEAGLVLMRDEDRSRIQFPDTIEVFLITPPSYDTLLKWLRDQVREKSEEKDVPQSGE